MISIITPTYNSSEYIDALIKSLQKQTCSDFEWVIVDDYSSEEDFKNLSKKINDSGLNVKIHRNTMNMGAGASRNVAFDIVSGDYIVFVDSDDYVSLDFIDVIKSETENNACDIFIFDYFRIIDGSVYRKYSAVNIEEGDVSLNQALLNVASSVWGKSFKIDLIRNNNIRFPKLTRFEDWVFNCNAFTNAKVVVYKKSPLYYYVDNQTSVTHKNANDVYRYSLAAFDLILKDGFLQKNNSQIFEFLYIQQVLYVAAINEANRLKTGKLKKLIQSLEQKYPNWRKNLYLHLLTKPQKMVILMLRFKMFFALKIFAKIFRR